MDAFSLAVELGLTDSQDNEPKLGVFKRKTRWKLPPSTAPPERRLQRQAVRLESRSMTESPMLYGKTDLCSRTHPERLGQFYRRQNPSDDIGISAHSMLDKRKAYHNPSRETVGRKSPEYSPVNREHRKDGNRNQQETLDVNLQISRTSGGSERVLVEKGTTKCRVIFEWEITSASVRRYRPNCRGTFGVVCHGYQQVKKC
jgi:hypothetical protein